MSADATKPANNWYHIPWQIAVVCVCLYWYWHPPAPNKAVLILTGVTVIMALWDMRPAQKLVYLLLIFCLMFIENRAIDKDRRDAAAADDIRRKDENVQFKIIADGIQQSITQSGNDFKATMLPIQALLGNMQDVSTHVGAITKAEEQAALETQKRQDIRAHLNAFASRGLVIMGECSTAGPVGSGGSSLVDCEGDLKDWTMQVEDYVNKNLPGVSQRQFHFASGKREGIFVDTRIPEAEKASIYQFVGRVGVVLDFLKECPTRPLILRVVQVLVVFICVTNYTYASLYRLRSFPSVRLSMVPL